MRDTLRHYTLHLCTQGPVFVGSGSSIGKKEYIFLPGEKKVYVPDTRRMFEFLAERGLLTAYESYLLNDYGDLAGWLRQNRIAKPEFLPWIAYCVDSGDAVFENRGKKEIATFIKDPYGCPYLPGSSLKGALRTALLGATILEEPRRYAALKARVQTAPPNQRRKYYLKKEVEEAEQQAFYTLTRNKKRPADAVNDMLSGLRIGDSDPLPLTSLALCQKVDMMVDGQVNRLNILRECIRPGVELRFDLTLDERLCPLMPEQILQALAVFSKNYEFCFRQAFAKRPGQPAPLYLGGGSGYVGKTVAYPLLGGGEKRRVSRILEATMSKKTIQQHRHNRDEALGASPHMLKCTFYRGKLYEMGGCNLSIE